VKAIRRRDKTYEGFRILDMLAFGQTEPSVFFERDGMREIYQRRVKVRVADVSMAMGMAKMMAQGPRGIFAGRLDVERMGVFGHSIGGYAAAHALSEIPALKGGVNLDGHAASMPFDVEHTPRKPFLCVEAPNFPPSDEKLAEWKTTRAEYDKMRRETDERQAAAYRENPTVSYRVTIEGAEHQSFGDDFFPGGERPNPKDLTRAQVTAATRAYLVAFFESTLRGAKPAILDSVPADFAGFTRIEVFGEKVD
jgi:pimeloyl-ACP methyl ester carboxylesterase